MKESEKRAKAELAKRGIYTDKRGGQGDPAYHVEDTRSFKEGPISRMIHRKTSKKK